ADAAAVDCFWDAKAWRARRAGGKACRLWRRLVRPRGEIAMKAAVLRELGQPLQIEEVQVDKPGPREVLIRTVAVGVCHSDLHFLQGAFATPLPTVLGHEAAGVVEA